MRTELYDAVYFAGCDRFVRANDGQKRQQSGVGFDAKVGKWVNMFDAGIVDPTKVTRSAILNASSISALFITTEAGVSEKKKDDKDSSEGSAQLDY